MFVILALKRLRQEDHYESEVSLGYLLNSWTTGATEAEISKKKKKIPEIKWIVLNFKITIFLEM